LQTIWKRAFKYNTKSIIVRTQNRNELTQETHCLYEQQDDVAVGMVLRLQTIIFPAVGQLCVQKLLQRVNTALIGGRSKPTGALTRSNWPPAPAPERCRPHVRPAERAVGVALERYVDVDEVEDVDAGGRHPDPVVVETWRNMRHPVR